MGRLTALLFGLGGGVPRLKPHVTRTTHSQVPGLECFLGVDNFSGKLEVSEFMYSTYSLSSGSDFSHLF